MDAPLYRVLQDVPVSMGNTFHDIGVIYCDAYFDSFLCWGPTPAGHTTFQNCPSARLSDPTQSAFRTCGSSGLWLGRRQNESSASGWTNYTPCFPNDVKILFDKVSEDENAQLKFQIARNTRILEIIGFSISLVALLLSLFIFTYFRSLRNNRTRIHKNLFSAMVLQVIVRLIVYIDQEFVRSELGDQSASVNASIHGIDNMPYLCELSYVMLEYGISVMFLWMFIEGLYLNNLVSTNVLKDNISHFVYFVIGWGLPFVLTIIWAIVTGLHYEKEEIKKCWYGYNFEPIYWIVQGPRLAVVIINFVFQLNILRVLVVKLRTSESTEVARVRKAFRAAFVLLPLLGLTNALDMMEPPLDGSVFRFACWSYITHFLRSFQGSFIALIYCFLNAEVRNVVRKHFANRQAIRETRRRQQSLFRNNGYGNSTHEGRASTSTSRSRSDGTQTRLQLRPLRWSRGQPHRRYSETGISLPNIEMCRRSTSTDTNSRLPRRYSAFSTLTQTVVTVEPQRTLHSCPLRNSDSCTISATNVGTKT